MQTDVKLIENNARVGADVAVELARVQRESEHATDAKYYLPPQSLSANSAVLESRPGQPSLNTLTAPSVIIFGSAALDITSQATTALVPGTTTPGRILLTPGGVGRNIAEAAQKLLRASSVQLISMVGNDMVGRVTAQEMDSVGLRTDGLVRLPSEDEGSAACTLHLGPTGDLEVGVADMGIVEEMGEDDVSCSC
jgi:pseudouridine-5'-phosphate glycosidase/pseudouridine kinase